MFTLTSMVERTLAWFGLGRGRGERVWCFVLNEFNVVLLLTMALVGWRPCVIDVQPSTPLGLRVLTPILAKLNAADKLGDIRELVPATERFWRFFSPNELGSLIGWFPQLADRIGVQYDYARLEALVPSYAEAAKGCVGNHLHRRIFTIFLLRDLERTGLEFGVLGVGSEIVGLYRDYWGEALTMAVGPALQLRRPVNVVLWLGALAIILGRLFCFVARRAKQAETVFFAVDQLDETRPRNVNLVDDILCGDADLLFVLRFPGIRAMPAVMQHLEGRNICDRFDGIIDWQELPGALSIAVGDMLRLLRAAVGQPPEIARAIFGLCYWRLVYRAFFRRHKVRYFWCRDDYTPEHHMRSQELRAIGGISLGIRHGVGWAGHLASYCHLDFDVLFFFGDEAAVSHYRPYWPAHLRTISIGTWGMTRVERAALPRSRSNAIIVATSNAPGGREAVQALYEVAAAFPDRTVIFRPKGTTYARCPDLTAAIQAVIANPPANVVVDLQGTYEGLGKAGYLISSPSSIVAEAVQFGLKAFALDQGFNHPEPWPLVYRNYPFLCVTDVGQAIERIRLIEAGDWRYPGEQLGDLIDLRGHNPFDAIRATLGLPPRDNGPLLGFWPSPAEAEHP